jgi:two-component system, chemotaxis family, protein-glutamate methylesterase/glutaminase
VTGAIRLVLVEDSATQRAALVRVLEAEGDITVVAEAASADAAVDEVARLRPQVVTMDLDLPGGGGQGAITRIMAETPTPILVLSGVIDTAGAPPAVAALAAGAVDALPKPRMWTEETARALRRQVRTVAAVPVVGRRRRAAAPARRPGGGNGMPVIGLAASTGGPAALLAVLRGLPLLPAPVLVVQHIHPSFVAGFATWLGDTIALPVALARDGEAALPGHVYVAPGETHLRLGPRARLTLSPEPRSVHTPSADELLHSIAREAGALGVGAVLTGMGDDGAAGLLAMRQAGGRTFAHDADTSTVFGMPRAAERLGAVQRMLPPERLAIALAGAVRELV